MVDNIASKPVIIRSGELIGSPSEYSPSQGLAEVYSYSAVATLPNGRYVVTFASENGVHYQLYEVDGTPFGPRFEISDQDSAGASVAPSGDGGFVVAWTGAEDSDGNTDRLFVRRFDAGGVPLGAATELNPNSSASERYASISALPPSDALPDGGFLAVWEEDTNVVGGFYQADGTLIRSFTANTFTPDWQEQIATTVLSDGRALVTWTSPGQDGDGSGVYGRIFNSDGTPADSEEFQINSVTEGVQNATSVAALADGGFVITWHSAGSIFAERFDASGASQGEVELGSFSVASTPSVAALADGGYVIAWADGNVVFAQRFGADGNALGGAFRVQLDINHHNAWIDVAGLADGGFTVVWSGGNGVYARDFHPVSDTVTAWEDHGITLPTRIALADTDGSEVLQSISIGGLPDGFSLGVGHPSGGPGSAWVIDRDDSAAAADFLDALAVGQVQIAIDPAANWNGDLTLSITATSRETSGDTTNTSDPFEVEVSVAAENDAPSVTLLDQPASYTEDSGRIGLGDIVVTDPDGDTITATLTLSDADAGALVGGSGTYDFETGIYTVTGTVADVNAALAAVEFLPSVNANDDVQITVEIDDGTATPITGTIELDGAAVSDAPRLSLGLPPVAVGNEDVRVDLGGDVKAQIAPSVATLANGGWVVTWLDTRHLVYEIYQRVYDADGQPVGAGDTLVQTLDTGSQIAPAVTALVGGGWVVTWQDNSGGDCDIYQQVYDANGQSVGDATVPVNIVQSADQRIPSVTGLANGGWVVTWQDHRAGEVDIYQQAYDADGERVGVETVVNSSQFNAQYTPSVTSLADGGWVVTWVDFSLSVRGDIRQRVFDANGQPTGADTLVAGGATFHADPAVTSLAGGGWVVTWRDERTGDYDIYQRIYDADGHPLGGDSLVNTQQVEDQTAPAVTALADGGWVVTWQGGPLNDTDIYQRVYGPNHEPIGNAEVLISAEQFGAQTVPSVTALPGGGWVVTWEDNRHANGMYNPDIYQRVFRPQAEGTEDAAFTLPVTVTRTDSSETITRVVLDLPEGWELTGGPAGSSITHNGNTWTLAGGSLSGTFNLTVQPEENADGDFSIGVTAYSQDGSATEASSGRATVLVSLEAVNDAPVAGPVALGAIPEDGSQTITAAQLLAEVNDVDNPAGDLNITDFDITSGGGSLVDNGGASWTYTADANANGEVVFTYTVSDGDKSDTGTAILNLNAVNDAPEVAQPLADRTFAEDHRVNFRLPADAFADVDNATLIYAAKLANGSGLPDWLLFDPTTRTFSGTPPQNFNGVLNIVVQANDGDLSASDTFRLTISPVNDAPLVTRTLARLTATEGDAFVFDLPQNAFTDPDGDALTYTVTLADGSALPSWLIYDADHHTLSGTPGYTAAGELDLRITARDPSGEAARATFTLTVEDDSSHGSDGPDVLFGGKGADTISGGGGNDKIHGGAGADTLRGDAGNDYLSGEPGDDTLFGGAGRDRLVGGKGEDRLDGGAGNDVLYGKQDADVLIGGKGDDIFLFRRVQESSRKHSDSILDFKDGDRIDLRAIDADTTARGNQKFHLGGDGAGELTVKVTKHTTFVQGDVNGDGKADLSIELSGKHHLGASDFLL